MGEQQEMDICATLPERDDVVDCVRSRGFLLESGAKRFRHTGKTLVKRLQAAPELAQQICLSLRLGMSARAVAIKFSISPNSVQAIRLALRERGELEAVAKGVDRVLDEFIELAAERIKEGILLGQIHPGQLPIPLMAAIDKRSQRDAGVVLGTGRTEGDVALENLDAAWALARRAVESQSNVPRAQVVDVTAADVISAVVDTSGATAVAGAERVEVVGLGGGDGSAAAAGNGAETGGGDRTARGRPMTDARGRKILGRKEAFAWTAPLSIHACPWLSQKKRRDLCGNTNLTDRHTEIMDWLNVHQSTIASEAFVDASAAQRGTWLCLLSYCSGQENGGVMAGAAGFDERKWLKLVGVSLAEAQDVCGLWFYEGNDVIVQFYRTETEAMLKEKRKNASLGGLARAAKAAAARASSTPDEPASSTVADVLQADSNICLKQIPEVGSAKGKGREGKGMKGKGSAHEADGFAHIPSEQEFLAAFIVEGIPEDYLRRQFTHFQASPKRWLDRGDIVDWRWLVRRRWTADAQTYSPRGAESGGGSEKKARGQSVAQQLFEIDRELADVKLRLDQAHELNQAPSAADTALERELKNRRDDIKGQSGGLAA